MGTLVSVVHHLVAIQVLLVTLQARSLRAHVISFRECHTSDCWTRLFHSLHSSGFSVYGSCRSLLVFMDITAVRIEIEPVNVLGDIFVRLGCMVPGMWQLVAHGSILIIATSATPFSYRSNCQVLGRRTLSNMSHRQKPCHL